jgi:hypothetical protein
MEVPQTILSDIRPYVTPHLRRFILERDNYQCVACWKKYNLRVDHIIPLYKGGLSIPDNLQVLCQSCNLSKGQRIFTSIEAFRNWRYEHGYPIYAILNTNGFFHTTLTGSN